MRKDELIAPEDCAIQYVKGIGERRAALYAKLGIRTAEDLLRHYPRSYIDLSRVETVAGAEPEEECAVRARVFSKTPGRRIRGSLTVFKVLATDGEADISLTFFNTKYTVDALKTGEEYIFYGTVRGAGLRREMTAPMVLSPSNYAPYLPVYAQTAGLSSKMISTNIRSALDKFRETVADPLPDEIRREFGLCAMQFALEQIHFPADPHQLAVARERLVFDELFGLALGMAAVRRKTRSLRGLSMPRTDWSEFAAQLPFTLTDAQSGTLNEIARDLALPTPMNRLLQGDVGSGKTAVSAGAAYIAHRNGFQTAVMVPTELLAEQHARTLSGLLGGLGVRVELLTGSLTKRQKTEVKDRLRAGESHLAVGTHALLQDDVEFARLGLIVTDEQHRFGVAQRMELTRKGERPHVLVMSATPIPRTLAYTLYGDLDLSVIDSMPVGRIPIKSYLIDGSKRERAYKFIAGHLERGFQGYIVCPLVERSPELEGVAGALELADELRDGFFAGFSVGLLHGKMKPAEKDAVMRGFAKGEIQLLVATTVIEVGIDIPNAVILLVENAERFGLSQLHQLRGRVGRGNEQSYCVLVSDAKKKETRARMRALVGTTDGFEIARQDLRLRGPGEFFGVRQHGEDDARMELLLDHEQLMERARSAADRILQSDPELAMEEHSALRRQVARLTELVTK